jgi:hypothetical protein
LGAPFGGSFNPRKCRPNNETLAMQDHGKAEMVGVAGEVDMPSQTL